MYGMAVETHTHTQTFTQLDIRTRFSDHRYHRHHTPSTTGHTWPFFTATAIAHLMAITTLHFSHL